MGYFDAIDNKIDKIQESGEIERSAGNAFWFGVGSMGILMHAIIFTLVFWGRFGSWDQLISGNVPHSEGFGGTLGVVVVIILCFVFALSVFLSVVGLVFNIKAHKAAALIREKNELNSMSTSFNILWIVLDIIGLVVNIAFLALFIGPNL